MFKKLFCICLLAVVLVPFANSQITTTLATKSIKPLDGSEPFAYIYTTPTDTAKDSTVYIKAFKYDLGGRTLFYGMNVRTRCDTFSLKLALDGSVNDTIWYGVDSVTVTPETVGQYIDNTDLTLIRYPYWRLRFSTAVTKLRETIGGSFEFFVLTNLKERF